jgi:CelD/BcsL family acetyltransferase involved in cellulose biosynthesis
MHVAAVRSLEQLEALEASWNALFDASASTNYFITFDWIYACAKRFVRPDELFVLAVFEGADLVGVAPMLKRGRALRFLMIEALADYCEVLFRPGYEEAVALIVDHALAERDWTTIELAGIPSTSPSCAGIERALNQRAALWRCETLCENPLVRTTGSFEQFCRTLKKKVRQEIRTTFNHLDRNGHWEVVELRSGDGAREIFDRLVALHMNRQRNKAGRSLFERPEITTFLRELIPGEDPPASRPAPILSALVSNGKVVAAAYSLVCNSVFYYWIPAFDANLRGASLGKALIFRLLERRFAEHCKQFDFMGGDESYKHQWADDRYYVKAFSVYRHRLQLAAHQMRRDVRDRLKQLKSRVPWLQRIWLRWTKR